MGNIAIADITLVFSVIMLGITVFQLTAIFRGTKVTAQVIGYDETENYDSESATSRKNLFPVYRYTYNGVTSTYRSGFAIWLNWIQNDTNQLYISKSGKVFEKEGAIASFAAAVILFLIV